MRHFDADPIDYKQIDFLPREHRQPTPGSKTIALLATVMLLYQLLLTSSASGKNQVAMLGIALIAVLYFYISLRKQQRLDLVMSTEFQNMLLAQAAAVDSAFCLLARRDGGVVYANDGLKKLFPNFNFSGAMALEGIFQVGNVNSTERNRLMNVLASGGSERFILPLRIKENETRDFVVTLHPLPRPGNYALIRGREFNESRTGAQILPSMLRTTSPEKLDVLLQLCPLALYTTDAFGRLEFTNPAMQQMLGFAASELTALSVTALVQEFQGKALPDDYTLTDHHGKARIKTKAGGTVEVSFEQHVQRDAHGKVTGAVGSFWL